MPEIAEFRVSSEGYRVVVHCRVAGGGATLGCHWVDPETGRYLRESAWCEVDDRGELVVDLPEALGPYRFYVSLREGEQWGYAVGRRFLVVDAEVGEAGVTLGRQEMTTLGRLRRERWPGLVNEVVVGPWRSLWVNRHLVRAMVGRDIAARYRGSFADAFWAILNPLLLMLTYYFVFGVFLRTRFPGDPSEAGYVLYFLAGMLPWLAMNETLARAPNTTLENRNLITKMIFPVEVLPLNLTLAGLVTGVTATAIFLVFLVVARGAVPVSVLWWPVVLVPQFLLTAGLCFLLAALGAFVRDVVYVMGLLLTMWFFLTPICYPETSLPAALLPVLGKNPLFVLVRGYRALFIGAAEVEWAALGKLALASLLLFHGGYAVFMRARRRFADVL